MLVLPSPHVPPLASVICFELRNGLDLLICGERPFSYVRCACVRLHAPVECKCRAPWGYRWVRHSAWNAGIVAATTTVAILVPGVVRRPSSRCTALLRDVNSGVCVSMLSCRRLCLLSSVLPVHVRLLQRQPRPSAVS